MINDQGDGRKIRINRGMEFMLRNKTEEESFRIIINKVLSFFTKEFHLKFEFKIKNKQSGKTNV
jgi:SHS2 domain-containing protein